MNPKKKETLFLIFLIILLFAINYPFLDRALEKFLIEDRVVFVERVIDGDTIVSGNNSIRLLGINSPERGQEYYEEAKVFLNDLVLNKTVRLEFGREKKDRYGRILAYVFLEGENIDLKLVEEGFANIYFPSGRDIHYKDFKDTWKECIESEKNLCEASEDKCKDCLILSEFNIKEQKVIINNQCSFSCDLTNWNIKDEGRKIFVFPEFILEKNRDVEIRVGDGINTEKILFWEREDYVWTESGDTLFLRDKEGKLVLWESY